MKLSLCGLAAFLWACPNTEYEVGVYKQFRVQAVSPAGEAADVPLDSRVVITFSDDLLESTVNAETVYLRDTTTDEKVPATLAYEDHDNAGPYVLTLTPEPGLDPDPTPDTPNDTPLAFSRRYAVHITPDLRREAKPDRPLEQIDEVGLTKEVVSAFRTVDPPPLEVLSAEPAQGSSGAPIDTAIRITFSETVEQASVTAESFAVEDVTDYGPAGAISGTFGFADSDASATLTTGNVVIFTPDSGIGYSRDVRVRLGTALRSARATDVGGNLSEPVTADFSTEDPPPLELVASTPGAGAANVDVDSALTLTFSESLDPASVPPAAASIAVEDTSMMPPLALPGSWALGSSEGGQDDQLLFQPDGRLPYGASITVALSQDVQSARATPRGGQLAAAQAIAFSTEPPPPLRLVSTTPQAGDSRVRQDVSVTLTFDQPVDPATVSASAVSVSDATADTPVAGALDVSNNVVTFTPQADLAFGHRIEVSLATSLTAAPAAGGGALSQPATVWFQIAPAPPLEVVGSEPADGAQNVAVATPVRVRFNSRLFAPTLPVGDVDADGNVDTGDGTHDTPANMLVGTCATPPCACAPSALDTLAPGSLSYEPDTATAIFTPNGGLAGNTTYQVCVGTGVYAVSGNQLENAYVTTFTTEVQNQVAASSPSPGEKGVSVTRPITVDFNPAVDCASVDADTFRLTYTNVFGQTAAIPGTLECDSGGATVTLTPAADTQPCDHPEHLLLYETTYSVELTSALQFGEDGLQGGDYSFEFTTTEAPQVTMTWPDAGDVGVPTVDPVLVSFSRPLPADPSTAWAADAVTLVNAADEPVSFGMARDSQDDHTLVITPDARLSYSETYTLTLAGGPNTDGTRPNVATVGPDDELNYLLRDVAIDFTTVEPLGVTLIPDAGGSVRNTHIAVLFNRPIDPSTIDASTFRITDSSDGSAWDGLRSVTTDGMGAIFVPTPELGQQQTVDVSLSAGLVRDAWGNPLADEFTGSVSTGSSRDNSGLSLSYVGPGSAAAPDTTVTLSLGDQPNPDALSCRGFVVRAQDGDTNLCRDVTYDVEQKQVSIQVADPGQDIYLDGGVTYVVEEGQVLSDLQLNDADDFSQTFTVEATRPTLEQWRPTAPTGGGAVFGHTRLAMRFSEPMRRTSFVNGVPADGGRFALVDAAGEPVDGTFAVAGNEVVFTPTEPLAAGETYTATLTEAVTDLAGNLLDAEDSSVALETTLTVEADPPTVDAVEQPEATSDVIRVAFSERMEPATLKPSVFERDGSFVPGTVRLTKGTCQDPLGAEVFACFHPEVVDPDATPASGDERTDLILSPLANADDVAERLAPGAYCLTVRGTAAADVGGTSLGTDHQQTVNIQSP